MVQIRTKSPVVVRFDLYLPLLILITATSIIPLMTVEEILRTGTIDLFELGEGRVKLPFWVTMAIGWPVFIYFAVTFFIPAIASIIRGHLFILDGDKIVKGKRIISRNEIDSIRPSSIGGVLLQSKEGTLRVYPAFNPKGEQALAEFRRAESYTA